MENEEREMVDIVTPIITFLNTCPFLKKSGFSVGELRFINSVSEENALVYQGTPQPTPHQDVYGNVWLDKQANFLILLSRRKDDNYKTIDISNFLYNMETWVEEENFTDPNIPRIGSDPQTERMWVDNGRWYSGTKDKNIDIYQLQLHIKYRKNYDAKVQE